MAIYVGIAVAILAATAVGVSVVSRRARGWVGFLNAPELVNYSALSSYERDSFKVLRLGKAKRTAIYLYYLTGDEATRKITASHFTVRYMERLYMPHFYDVTKPLYTVVLWGDLDPNFTPTVTLSTGPETLNRLDLSGGPTWSNSESIAKRQKLTDQTVPQIPGVMPREDSTLFSSRGDVYEGRSTYSQTTMTPTPLYECDSFESGVSQISICVFRSPNECINSRIIDVDRKV